MVRVVAMKGHPDEWIGWDLDGTLAKRIPGRYDPTLIGEPVPRMVALLGKAIDEGENCKIMTARVAVRDLDVVAMVERAVRAWCLRHVGCELPITCMKDGRMKWLYDDRAITVEADTGIVLTVDRETLDRVNREWTCSHMDCGHRWVR